MIGELRTIKLANFYILRKHLRNAAIDALFNIAH
jgi:hypothetical protein